MGTYKTNLEKKVGKGTFILGILGAVWIGFKFIGAILAFLLAGMNGLVTGAVIVAALLLYRNSKIKTACWYGYEIFISKAVGMFITTNKIDIVKNYLNDLKKKADDLMKHINTFKADLINLKNEIKKFKKERTENAQKAQYLRSQPVSEENNTEIKTSAMKVARLTETIAKFEKMYDSEFFLCKKFIKMYEVSANIIEKVEYDVKMQVKEFEMSKKYSKTMKDGLGAMGADKDKKAMYNEAVEKMEEDIAKNAADIDTFMNIASKIVTDSDMKSSMEESEGFKLLEAWEKSGGFENMETILDKAVSTETKLNEDLAIEGHAPIIKDIEEVEFVEIEVTQPVKIEQKVLVYEEMFI